MLVEITLLINFILIGYVFRLQKRLNKQVQNLDDLLSSHKRIAEILGKHGKSISSNKEAILDVITSLVNDFVPGIESHKKRENTLTKLTFFMQNLSS